MKVLLIQAYSKAEEQLVVYPIGLSRIASALTEHEVEIYDPNIYDEPYVGLGKIMERFNPGIIGISIRNIDSPQGNILYYLDSIELLVKTVKKKRPDIRIMVGGTGFSMFAEEIMGRIYEIDFGIFLEGEMSVSALMVNLDNPHKVKGIYYRENGVVCFTGHMDYVDLDSLPLLRWDLCLPNSYMKYPDGIGIDTKRGCVKKCAYCMYPYLSGSTLRLCSPKKIVDEVEHLITSYNVKRIMFADNVFNLPIKHAEEICKEIIKRKLSIQWTAWFSIKPLTKEFMELAVESGCIDFAFSPDAYSNRVLKILKKDITPEDIMKSYYLVRTVKGAMVSYNFLVNPPGQNLFSFLQILIFLLKVKIGLRKRLISFNFWHTIRIYPRTELSRIAISEGVIDDSTDLLFPAYYRNLSAPHVDTLYGSLKLAKSIVKSVLRGRKTKRTSLKERP